MRLFSHGHSNSVLLVWPRTENYLAISKPNAISAARAFGMHIGWCASVLNGYSVCVCVTQTSRTNIFIILHDAVIDEHLTYRLIENEIPAKFVPISIESRVIVEKNLTRKIQRVAPHFSPQSPMLAACFLSVK